MKTTITILVIAGLAPATVFADNGNGVTDTPPLSTAVRGIYADAHGRQWPVYHAERRLATLPVRNDAIRKLSVRSQVRTGATAKVKYSANGESRSGSMASSRVADSVPTFVRFANLHRVSSGVIADVAAAPAPSSADVVVRPRPFTLDSRSRSRRVY